MTDTTTEHSGPLPAVGAPVEQPVRLDPDRAAFNAWMDSPVAPGEAPEPWISDLAAEAAWQAWKHRGAEIERLRAALAKANEQAERFERGWYLRGDALEKLEQWARAYPLKVFPEPLREEWQRAAALLSEKGLSLDRMSASNMRHVISGVRKLVDEGLKA